MPKPPLELEIHINEQGEVVLTELPQEMAELVLELDPDHVVACRLNPSEHAEKNEQKDDKDPG